MGQKLLKRKGPFSCEETNRAKFKIDPHCIVLKTTQNTGKVVFKTSPMIDGLLNHISEAHPPGSIFFTSPQNSNLPKSVTKLLSWKLLLFDWVGYHLHTRHFSSSSRLPLLSRQFYAAKNSWNGFFALPNYNTVHRKMWKASFLIKSMVSCYMYHIWLMELLYAWSMIHCTLFGSRGEDMKKCSPNLKMVWEWPWNGLGKEGNWLFTTEIYSDKAILRKINEADAWG